MSLAKWMAKKGKKFFNSNEEIASKLPEKYGKRKKSKPVSITKSDAVAVGAGALAAGALSGDDDDDDKKKKKKRPYLED